MLVASSAFLWFCIGVVAGALATWLLLRTRTTELALRLAGATDRLASAERGEGERARALTAGETTRRELETQVAALRAREDVRAEASVRYEAELAKREAAFADHFAALSARALRSASEQFLTLAKERLGEREQFAAGELDARKLAVKALVDPLASQLKAVDDHVRLLEKTRADAYGKLEERLENLMRSEARLATQTEQLNANARDLVTALKSPITRGRWGELQLRRVVELAGMHAQCDFDEQTTVETSDSRSRPDMTVRMPGGRVVHVDAKAPLAAFLESVEATTEELRRDRMRAHARRLRDHVTQLSRRNYDVLGEANAEFVVMFVPGESFLSAALAEDAEIVEYALERRVLIAGPMSLVSLLKSIAFGWRQEALQENAGKIAELGRELYDRLATVGERLDAVGKALDQSVRAYNKTVGSLETRVFVSARKLRDYGAAGGAGELAAPRMIETGARPTALPEAFAGGGEPAA